MRLYDLTAMALRNLFARKIRTALNLFGLIVGSLTLLLTLSGTRGVADSLIAIICETEESKRIQVPSQQRNAEPPAEVIRVDGEMSEERRTHLANRLREEWMYSSTERPTVVGTDDLEAVGKIEHVVEVFPNYVLTAEIVSGDIRWNCNVQAISDEDRSTKKKLIAGRLPDPSKGNELLLSDFAAYKLGYHTIDEAKGLVGQTLKIRFRRERVSGIDLLALSQASGESELTEDQKNQVVRSLPMLIEALIGDAIPDSIREWLPEVELPNADDESFFVDREVVVSGVTGTEPGTASPPGFLQWLTNGSPDVGMHYESMKPIVDETQPFIAFFTSTVRVDSARNLDVVTEDLRQLGLDGFSASWLIDSIETQINQSRWIVVAIAGLILLITSFGISNTLVISVLQRTPEFGIMKSLGASSFHLMGMMLFEGGVLGFCGSILSIAFAWPISLAFDHWVRAYVSSQIGQDFTGLIFESQPLDFLIAIGVSTLVGVIASLVPAIRAARLNPIEALRSV